MGASYTIRMRFWKKPGAVWISVLIMAVARGTPAEPTVALAPANRPVPASYFSLNILFHPLTQVPWPSVPFGGWRLSHVNWADLEPEQDRWNFDLLDKYVSWGQEHHTEILMALTYTPRWDSSTPDAATDVEVGNPPGLSGAPRDMQSWRTFVHTVAIRYKGRIHDWEMWNEPNRPQSWTGSVEQMVAMTREASQILKRVDPDNIVVSPTPTGSSGIAFLQRFLQDGGGQYVDVVGYHFYAGSGNPPEAEVALIQQVKSLMRQYGAGDKPLWNTETGWLGSDQLSQRQSAAYVARAYILNWAAGVSRFYWYAWDDHHGAKIQMTEQDNATLAPAGEAFAAVQKWLLGAVMNRCASSEDGTWICTLHRDKRISHIAWNSKGDKSFAIPASWRARHVIGLCGRERVVHAGRVEIGSVPIRLQ